MSAWFGRSSLALLALLTLASGCGGGGSGSSDGGPGGTGQGVCASAPSGSCSQTQNGKTYCADYAGSGAALLVSACMQTAGATGSSNACTHQSSIGGCRQQLTPNVCSTTWAYPPDTEAQNRPSCEAGGGTWVAP
jgi:hypothetical protein